ncbi:MAG: methyltransferase domain-containing protein [Bryobacteraceae bacterium]
MSVAHNLRHALNAVDKWLSRWDQTVEPSPQGSRARYDEIVAFLRTLDMPSDARNYLEIHMNRIGVTLCMVPPPAATSRVLELGAYMQMTPALGCVLGYQEVRGAYFGEPGRVDHKSIQAGGKEVFTCEVDHFNCEKHRFPYEDGRFDCVLACEIFEHMLLDPMHMLFEIHRVLADNGAVVLTTPNVASYTAVARALEQSGNPQLYSMYPYPHGEFRDTEIPHVREYTPNELTQSLEAAGFAVEHLFTERVDEYNSHLWVEPFLERFGYPAALRGEQMYCLARKRSGAAQTRYPGFLYEGC